MGSARKVRKPLPKVGCSRLETREAMVVLESENRNSIVDPHGSGSSATPPIFLQYSAACPNSSRFSKRFSARGREVMNCMNEFIMGTGDVNGLVFRHDQLEHRE